MRSSTILLGLGAGLFVLPIPGTFVTGGVVLLVGAITRWLGS